MVGGVDVLKQASMAQGRRSIGRPSEEARMSEDSAIGNDPAIAKV